MKKQFLFFLFCLCAGVSNVWAQETDWSPLFTRVCEVLPTRVRMMRPIRGILRMAT